jgi:hypothetical protein
MDGNSLADFLTKGLSMKKTAVVLLMVEWWFVRLRKQAAQGCSGSECPVESGCGKGQS